LNFASMGPPKGQSTKFKVQRSKLVLALSLRDRDSTIFMLQKNG
jgi:hypothetical protein